MKVNTFEDTNLTDAKIAIVRSRFNEPVTQRMLDGCLDTLRAAGLKENDIEVFEVPGAFEIPLVANQLAKKDFEAVITLGCITRGETPHDRYISHASIEKLQDISLKHSKPIILGIITPLDQAQADARSTGENNKGIEAAKAAIEMIHLSRSL